MSQKLLKKSYKVREYLRFGKSSWCIIARPPMSAISFVPCRLLSPRVFLEVLAVNRCCRGYVEYGFADPEETIRKGAHGGVWYQGGVETA